MLNYAPFRESSPLRKLRLDGCHCQAMSWCRASPSLVSGLIRLGLGEVRKRLFEWENHRKTMGKPWENHAKTMGKWRFYPLVNEHKWKIAIMKFRDEVNVSKWPWF